MKIILKTTDEDLKEYEQISQKLQDRYLDINTDASHDKELMLEAYDAIDWLITLVKNGEYQPNTNTTEEE